MDRDDARDVSDQAGSLPAHLAARVESIVRAAEQEATKVQQEIDAQRRVAEAEGRRYLVEARHQAEALIEERARRMRELTDELIARAETTKREFDGLIAALQRASLALERGEPPAAPAAEAQAPPRPPPPAPPPPPHESSPVGSQASGESEPGAGRSGFAPPPPPPGHHGAPSGGARPGAELDPAAQAGVPQPEPAWDTDPRREDMEAARLVAIEMAVAGRTREDVDRHLRESFRIPDTTQLLDDVFGSETGGGTRASFGR